MVCLGTSPTNQKVIRTAARMAQAFHADLQHYMLKPHKVKICKKSNYNQLNPIDISTSILKQTMYLLMETI